MTGLGQLTDEILDTVLSKISMRRVFAWLILIGLIIFILSAVSYGLSLDWRSVLREITDTRHFFVVSGNLALGYITKWGILLSIYATLLLAFAAFWVISDTRHFRFLDDKEVAINNLTKWAAETIATVSSPSLPPKNMEELRRSWLICRIELLNKVAESIGIFEKTRKLIAKPQINKVIGSKLDSDLRKVDEELNIFINELFLINFDKLSMRDLLPIIDKVSSLVSSLRKVIETSSKI